MPSPKRAPALSIEFNEEHFMASNRGIAYIGPGKVDVRRIDYPKLVGPGVRRCDHGVILKIVTTCADPDG
jgi:hypothetical protein